MARRFRQVVPRPERSRPGTTPPWSRLSPRERERVDLPRVRRALAAAGLSGTGPYGTGAPSAPSAATLVDAAVLAALFEQDGEAMLVLIRRAAALERDPGHVALPGGRVEPGEPALAAALREAHEEIGLDPAAVEVLGHLPPMRPHSAAHQIAPFIAALEDRPHLAPSPEEVEAVFEVPLFELLADGVAWEEHWGEDAAPEAHRVCFFAVPSLGDDLLWGLTGRVVWELLELVATVPHR